MSEPVFKIGDSVYLPGKDKPLKITSAIMDKGTWHYTTAYVEVWVKEDSISFTPWPKADHNRPIQEGWWCFEEKYPNGFSKYRVGWLKQDKLYIDKGKPEYWPLDSTELVCFLGSEVEPKSQLDKT